MILVLSPSQQKMSEAPSLKITLLRPAHQGGRVEYSLERNGADFKDLKVLATLGAQPG
jgi:hypothetical protein